MDQYLRFIRFKIISDRSLVTANMGLGYTPPINIKTTITIKAILVGMETSVVAAVKALVFPRKTPESF